MGRTGATILRMGSASWTESATQPIIDEVKKRRLSAVFNSRIYESLSAPRRLEDGRDHAATLLPSDRVLRSR
jgi:hypothetical protein